MIQTKNTRMQPQIFQPIEVKKGNSIDRKPNINNDKTYHTSNTSMEFRS